MALSLMPLTFWGHDGHQLQCWSENDPNLWAISFQRGDQSEVPGFWFQSNQDLRVCPFGELKSGKKITTFCLSLSLCWSALQTTNIFKMISFDDILSSVTLLNFALHNIREVSRYQLSKPRTSTLEILHKHMKGPKKEMHACLSMWEPGAALGYHSMGPLLLRINIPSGNFRNLSCISFLLLLQNLPQNSALK